MSFKNSRKIGDLSIKELECTILEYMRKYEEYTRMYNPKINHVSFFYHSCNIETLVLTKKATFEIIKKEYVGILSYLLDIYNKELLEKVNPILTSIIKSVDKKVDIFQFIENKAKSIKNINESNKIIRNRPINDRGDVEAVLQLNSRETEDMEHTLQQICSHINSDIDVEEILSVYKKIKRGDTYVTDVRAIRDGTSHGNYMLEENKIIFSMNTHGYNFHQEFTFKEFEQFMGLKGQMYGIIFDIIDYVYFGNLLKVFCDKIKNI